MSPRVSPASGRGFTLVELMVVMVIAVAAVALITPMFGGAVSSAELRQSARQVAAALRAARSEAVSTNQPVAWVLDVEAKRFSLSSQSGVRSLPERLEVELTTAESELQSENIGAIRFYPDGTSSGGRVALGDARKQLDVDVDWLTGRVRILQ